MSTVTTTAAGSTVITTREKTIKIKLAVPSGQLIGDINIIIDGPRDENSVFTLRTRVIENRGWRARHVVFSYKGAVLREDHPLTTAVGMYDGCTVTVQFDMDSAELDSPDLPARASEGHAGANRLLHMACDLLAPLPVLTKILAACPEAAAVEGIRNQRPLHFIAKCRDVECVRLIGDACPESARAKTNNGWTPLHMAASAEAGEATLLYLLSLHPAAAAEATLQLSLPMHVLLSQKSVSMAVLRALQEAHPPALRAVQRDNWTPVMFAVAMRLPEEVLLYLLEKAPDTAAIANANSSLLLHHAAQNSKVSPALVRRLLELHPDGVRVQSKSGATPLNLAVQAGCGPDVIRLLLDAFPEAASIPNEKGITPISFAAQKNASPAVMRLLLDALPPGGASKLPKFEGATPLLLALRERSDAALVDMLLDAAPDAVREADDKGVNCLMKAAANCHPSTLRLLQAWPEGAAALTSEDWSALHFAAQAAMPGPTLRAILNAAPQQARKPTKNPWLPISLYLERGPQADPDGVAALLEGHPEVVRELLHAMMPLSVAISRRLCTRAVMLIWDAHPEAVSIPSAQGWLALHHACHRPVTEMAVFRRLLAEHPQGVRHVTTKERLLPLHVAAMEGAKVEAVRLLIEAYPEALRVVTGDGELPLHAAITGPGTVDAAVVSELIAQYPAALTARQKDGAYPLHLACGNGPQGSFQTVLVLMDAAPQVLSWPDDRGRLPAHYACEREAPVALLAAVLARYPEAATTPDKDGRWPVHCGECVPTLVEAIATLPPTRAARVLPSCLLRCGERPPVFLDRQWARVAPLVTAIAERAFARFRAIGVRAAGGSGGADAEVLQPQPGGLGGVNAASSAAVPGAAAMPADSSLQGASSAMPSNTAASATDAAAAAAAKTAGQSAAPDAVAAAAAAAEAAEAAQDAALDLPAAAAKYVPWFGELCSLPVAWADPPLVACVEQLPSAAHARALASLMDCNGRAVIGAAREAVKVALQKRLYLLGRYDVASGRPEHESATCVVRRALDRSVEPPLPVALKFMRFREHFERELRARSDFSLSGEHVLPVLADFDGDADPRVSEEAPHHGFEPGYSYAVALPAAQRTLADIIAHEHVAGRKWPAIREIAGQLAAALGHLHERGLVHGDVKPLNIMRAEGRYLLIDLDAATPLGQPAGAKYSSGFLPPEMIYVPPTCEDRHDDDGDGNGDGDGDGADGFDVAPSAAAGAHASLDGAGPVGSAVSGTRGVGVRVKVPAEALAAAAEAVAGSGVLHAPVPAAPPSAASLPYEPVPAAPPLDMWSLGVTLFHLCANQPLFLMDSEGNVGADGLRDIAAWSPLAAAARLRHIADPLARNFVAQLLHPSPNLRPTAARLLAHPFVTGAKALTRLPGQEPKYDVFLSYRVAADRRHVARLYELLTAAGLRVWWDAACLPLGKDWEVGFCEGLVASRTAALLLSQGGLSAFRGLASDSPCDNVLLEHRLALELAQLGLLDRVLPIMLSDVHVPEGDSAPRAASLECFTGRYLPTPASFPNVAVTSVDAKLADHMAHLCLGTPAVPSQGPADTLRALMKMQGFLLAAPAPAADGAADVGEPVEAALHRAAEFLQRAVQEAKSAAAATHGGLARGVSATGDAGTGAGFGAGSGTGTGTGTGTIAGSGGLAPVAPTAGTDGNRDIAVTGAAAGGAGSAMTQVAAAAAAAADATSPPIAQASTCASDSAIASASAAASLESSAPPHAAPTASPADALPGFNLLGLGPLAGAPLQPPARLQALLAALQAMTGLARSSVPSVFGAADGAHAAAQDHESTDGHDSAAAGPAGAGASFSSPQAACAETGSAAALSFKLPAPQAAVAEDGGVVSALVPGIVDAATAAALLPVWQTSVRSAVSALEAIGRMLAEAAAPQAEGRP